MVRFILFLLSLLIMSFLGGEEVSIPLYCCDLIFLYTILLFKMYFHIYQMRVNVFIKLITNYYYNIDFHKNKSIEAMQVSVMNTRAKLITIHYIWRHSMGHLTIIIQNQIKARQFNIQFMIKSSVMTQNNYFHC